MKTPPPPTSHLPPPILLAIAALVPTIALLALAALHIPLGKPGALVYTYSTFDGLRLTRIAFALPPIGMLALAVVVAARERRGEWLGLVLLAAGLTGMGVWALTAAPKWQRQNFFNMATPSHDGAFLREVEYVRSVGIPEYLRAYDQRAATPPAEMQGTRIISNPPGFTLLATLCDSIVSANPGLRELLERCAIDSAEELAETRFLAARALLFASVLIGMWVAGGLLLYAAARTLVDRHVAMFIAICSAVTPMTLLFTPGKDPAQLLTVALPLWLWLAALKRRSAWLAGLAGAAACLACFGGLVHAWVAACVVVASLMAILRLKDTRLVFRLLGAAIGGLLLVSVAIWWLSGYDLLAAARAIATAQAKVTRGDAAMPFIWQVMGVLLFLLFCGPALWFLPLALGRGSAPSPHAMFGRALILVTAVVMLLTVGFTNIETPRLWIPFAVLLTLGLTIASRWVNGDRRTVARLLACVAAVQGLVSAYQWSKMDMRETEMRLLESPEGGARLFH